MRHPMDADHVSRFSLVRGKVTFGRSGDMGRDKRVCMLPVGMYDEAFGYDIVEREEEEEKRAEKDEADFSILILILTLQLFYIFLYIYCAIYSTSTLPILKRNHDIVPGRRRVGAIDNFIKSFPHNLPR